MIKQNLFYFLNFFKNSLKADYTYIAAAWKIYISLLLSNETLQL